MYLQVQPPAETLNYMIAGFVVIFGVMLVYIASLMVRRRSLDQDIRTLEELQDQD